MMPLVDMGVVLNVLERYCSLCRYAEARCLRTRAWLAAQRTATTCAATKGWCGR